MNVWLSSDMTRAKSSRPGAGYHSFLLPVLKVVAETKVARGPCAHIALAGKRQRRRRRAASRKSKLAQRYINEQDAESSELSSTDTEVP